MAHNESSFKGEFKKDLKKTYADRLEIWSHLDAARSGLPDMAASFEGGFYPIEAKFAKAIPKRGTSQVLDHPLTTIQGEFLAGVYRTGNYPMILVGFPDVAVAVPYSLWPRSKENPRYLAPNILLDDILKIRGMGYGFQKLAGTWQVSNFFEQVRARRE